MLAFSCKKKVQGPEDFDGLSIATPNGAWLRLAETGPVRSALGQPQVDLNTYQLTITGMVDSAYALSYEDIQKMESVTTDTMLLYCVEGWEVLGNWRGILLRDLLQTARIQNGGMSVFFRCLDGYSTALPLSYVLNNDVLLAYEVNGKPLRSYDGFPLRVVAPRKFGYKWAKWVTEVWVYDQSYLGYWERTGWSNQADVPVSRRNFYKDVDKAYQ